MVILCEEVVRSIEFVEVVAELQEQVKVELQEQVQERVKVELQERVAVSSKL